MPFSSRPSKPTNNELLLLVSRLYDEWHDTSPSLLGHHLVPVQLSLNSCSLFARLYIIFHDLSIPKPNPTLIGLVFKLHKQVRTMSDNYYHYRGSTNVLSSLVFWIKWQGIKIISSLCMPSLSQISQHRPSMFLVHIAIANSTFGLVLLMIN